MTSDESLSFHPQSKYFRNLQSSHGNGMEEADEVTVQGLGATHVGERHGIGAKAGRSALLLTDSLPVSLHLWVCRRESK